MTLQVLSQILVLVVGCQHLVDLRVVAIKLLLEGRQLLLVSSLTHLTFLPKQIGMVRGF